MIEIIIFFVVIAFMGSAFWILPSPKERRLMALRNRALVDGFSVRFTDIETKRQDQDGDWYEINLICYASNPARHKPVSNKNFECFILDKSSGETGDEKLWVVEKNFNIEAKKQEQLIIDVQNCPALIKGLGFTGSSVRFYWLEDTQDLAKLAELEQFALSIWKNNFSTL
ncbi:ligand-gated ion channel [Oleiphilus messinensis]|nr:hypothetical protein [Oleiphilus messinensis]